ncbi:hypothetical protein ACOJBM_41765 [Rhizobium beringeri]
MTAFRGILGSNVTDDALCLFDGGAAPEAFSICGSVFGLGTAEKATLITRHDYIIAICGCPRSTLKDSAQPLSADQVAPSILRGGADLVSRLSGCFSLAHWSMRDACLTLYRDPSGTYPLSYQQRDGRLIFASDNGERPPIGCRCRREKSSYSISALPCCLGSKPINASRPTFQWSAAEPHSLSKACA